LKTSSNVAYQILSPDNLLTLVAVADQGSLAAGARALGLVPSALSYRMRQLEEQLDLLIIDRRTGRGLLTEAGQELVKQGRRLLSDTQSVANRVKRIASGWEPTLSIAIDTIIARNVVLELCERFYKPFNPDALCPTQLRIHTETLSGTWEALTSGEVDLAIGVVVDEATAAGISSAPLGEVPFVFAVAAHHPLAKQKTPITDAQLQQVRAVAVADSARRLPTVTLGLLEGQDVLTVPDMAMKLEVHLRGLACGFLPMALVAPYEKSGQLVVKKTQRKARVSQVRYAWREQPNAGGAAQAHGNATNWWLSQLKQARTRAALLGQYLA
jgi:DNA-binding transcriptional LysR family regulator